jgi:chaperonin cofactor prefoldin
MYRLSMTAALAALVVVMLPAAAGAQTQQQELPPQVQEWIGEAQRLQAQLAAIHEQAMEHPPIAEEQEAVEKAVRDAMIAEDSAVAGLLDRMEVLIEEARQAQEAGDTIRLQTLGAEAAAMQPTLESAQLRALEKPEIEARIQALQQSVEARMSEIEPQVEQMIARFTELDRQIRTALGGGG